MLENPGTERPASARRSDSGKGYAGLVITLLVLVVAGYIAVQAVPVYIDNYELQQTAHDLAQQAAVNHIPLEAITPGITNRAAELDLPVGMQNVAASIEAGVVRVRVRYTVPIDLKIYTWPMNLSISTSAPRLIN
ncbi:MAG: hypothetical protein ACRD4Q_07800 [Candidatus Acidiferrales bacterium]